MVATTRPETMLGDTAVAVNPRDERYRDLVGQMIVLPILNREIPVIADDYVDMEFGTGYGMPLVKKFVEAYGGTIKISSKEETSDSKDHGTEITLSLISCNTF